MPPVTTKVIVAGAAWETIRRETTAADDGLETGGILLGHHIGDLIRITIAGDPGPNARREPKEFLRDLDHAQQLAASAWERDQSQWVGEWHTHPTGEPVPSAVDLDSYARHLADPDLGFTHFTSLIVGNLDVQPAVAAWVVTADAATVTPLTIERTP